MSSQVKNPGNIHADLAYARQLSDDLARGDRSGLADLLATHYDFFMRVAANKVFSGLDPGDVVQAFCEVLLKGNIFRTYQGSNNCSLKSFLTRALIYFIYSENRNKTGKSEVFVSGKELPESESEVVYYPRSSSAGGRNSQVGSRNKETIRYVEELLRKAIVQRGEKIRIWLEEDKLNIALSANGKEQKYPAPSNSQHYPFVIPRVKFIAGIKPQGSPPQRGGLSMTNSGRQVFLFIATILDRQGNEMVEITLHDKADACPSEIPEPYPPFSQWNDSPVETDEDTSSSDGEPADESPVTTVGEKGRVAPLAGFLDELGWFGSGTDRDNEANLPPSSVRGSSAQQEEILVKNEAVIFHAKIIKESLSRLELTHPEDAKLIRMRIEEMEFADIAIALEKDPKNRSQLKKIRKLLKKHGEAAIDQEQDLARRRELQNAQTLLKTKTDTWKHRYERKDGPSALYQFAVTLERQLVSKNIQLDESLHQITANPEENEEMRRILAQAIDAVRLNDENMARIAEIQLYQMRDAEIALLLGTINGRKITSDDESRKSSEIKALQKTLIAILKEQGLELTSIRGIPRIRKMKAEKTEHPVTKAQADATEIHKGDGSFTDNMALTGKTRAKNYKRPGKTKERKKKG